MGTNLLSVNFEVFGRVQGVFFRKYTLEQAERLGVRGWCRNTRAGTVEGVIEGENNQIAEMKYWLANVGSKASKIDKVEFKDEKEISDYSFPKFVVRT